MTLNQLSKRFKRAARLPPIPLDFEASVKPWPITVEVPHLKSWWAKHHNHNSGPVPGGYVWAYQILKGRSD